MTMGVRFSLCREHKTHELNVGTNDDDDDDDDDMMMMEVGTHRCKLLLWLVNFGNLAMEERPMVVTWIREGRIRGDIWELTTRHLW